MSLDSTTIDRIVAGVLEQLGEGEESAPMSPESSVQSPEPARATVFEHVITASVLESFKVGTHVTVEKKAIVTPAAWDAAKERGIEIARMSAKPQTITANVKTGAATGSVTTQGKGLLIVVRSTDAVDQVYDNDQAHWTRELLGCPDDAAALAISELTRGTTKCVVILAAQTHRAACLANRSDKVQAVAINDAADIPSIRKQLRVNAWCVDPTDKSWFELHRLLSFLTPKS